MKERQDGRERGNTRYFLPPAAAVAVVVVVVVALLASACVLAWLFGSYTSIRRCS